MNILTSEQKKNILLRNLIDLFYFSHQKTPINTSSIHSGWLQNLFYKNPINLLFSIDQFVYEFLTKYPQRRKISEYKLQIKEQKKLSLFYGYLSKKQFKKYLIESKAAPGEFSKKLIGVLERRLDVVVYRSQFAKNVTVARQLITHKKVLVNNKPVSIPSYQVNPGDIVSIDKKFYENIISDRIVFLKSQFKKEVFSPAVSESIVKNWMQGKHKWSKNQLELFTKLLVKKIERHVFMDVYQNPFSSLPVRQNYPYFNIYTKSKLSLKEEVDKKENHGYRRLLRECISTLSIQDLQKQIFLLYIKKYGLKKLSLNNAVQNISLVGVKPLHLEVSYKTLQCILLYSPQRIYYPFLINFDILKRAYIK